MKDNWTLYKFLQNYYRNSPNRSERTLLINTVCNMGISNYTLDLLKKLMQESDEISPDSITDEAIINF